MTLLPGPEGVTVGEDICTSGEGYAPTVDIPEDMCEYDQIRQKNIEDRLRKFRELGLKEAKTKLK